MKEEEMEHKQQEIVMDAARRVQGIANDVGTLGRAFELTGNPSVEEKLRRIVGKLHGVELILLQLVPKESQAVEAEPVGCYDPLEIPQDVAEHRRTREGEQGGVVEIGFGVLLGFILICLLIFAVCSYALFG